MAILKFNILATKSVAFGQNTLLRFSFSSE